MNSALWPALREYIAAEVQLALVRHRLAEHYGVANYHDGAISPMALIERAKALQEQVTRMETAVRDGLEFAQCNQQEKP